MKKYFVTETDEICNFGDELHLTFYKDLEDGKVTVEKDIVFSEATMDWMIEMGFVEEREVEDEELLSFEDERDRCENCIMNNLFNDRLEEVFNKLWEMYKSKLETCKHQKTASPKKK